MVKHDSVSSSGRRGTFVCNIVIAWIVLLLTRVRSNTQLVFAFLTGDAKEAVLGVSCFSVRVCKIRSKPASLFCQAVILVKSEPEFTIQVSEASFVVIPAAVEINRAAQSLLEHCPSPTGCSLITVHIKGTGIVGVDRVNTVGSLTSFVELSTVLVNCKHKMFVVFCIKRNKRSS